MSVVHPVDCKGQGRNFSSGIDDFKITVERDKESFYYNLHPTPLHS